MELSGEAFGQRSIAALLGGQVNLFSFVSIDEQKWLIFIEFDFVLIPEILVHSLLGHLFRFSVPHPEDIGRGVVLVGHTVDLIRFRVVSSDDSHSN
jgi:hypothetical protein